MRETTSDPPHPPAARLVPQAGGGDHGTNYLPNCTALALPGSLQTGRGREEFFNRANTQDSKQADGMNIRNSCEIRASLRNFSEARSVIAL